MSTYPELIDRIFRERDLLKKLCPTEPHDRGLLGRVKAASDEEILGASQMTAKALALIRGALFYALDDLESAHRFFQEGTSDLGSYWHGMLHRREADFDNARYWFRRAGSLPFFSTLHSAAAEFSSVMARQSNWDPYLFTGECEQVRFGSEETEKLPEVQRAEFEVAFGYGWRQSLAGG